MQELDHKPRRLRLLWQRLQHRHGVLRRQMSTLGRQQLRLLRKRVHRRQTLRPQRDLRVPGRSARLQRRMLSKWRMRRILAVLPPGSRLHGRVGHQDLLPAGLSLQQWNLCLYRNILRSRPDLLRRTVHPGMHRLRRLRPHASNLHIRMRVLPDLR